MATKPKDLRTGRSIWQSLPASKVRARALRHDLETDVLIVGAGITGAMIADALAANGIRVVIVDKRGPAEGATTASTALVQHEIDRPLRRLSLGIGKADAIRAWRRSRLAVDAIAARLRELAVRDVVRRDSLYLAGNLLDPDELFAEHKARLSAGLASHYLDRGELGKRFGIRRGAALLSYDSLVINPRRATFALLKAALANGATIYASTEIVEIDAKRSAISATSDEGRHIHCHQLVFATGYELPNCAPRRGHKIISTWAIATPPQPRRLWPQQCTIWEASEPYLYLRTTSDGRIICGGEDEDFSDEEKRDARLLQKSKTLSRKLGRLIRGAKPSIDFAWTGSFGETATGLPIIDRVPGMPNCWIALGYGGNGTTYARIAADIIAGAIVNRTDTDADLYRFPPSATARSARNGTGR